MNWFATGLCALYFGGAVYEFIRGNKLLGIVYILYGLSSFVLGLLGKY